MKIEHKRENNEKIWEKSNFKKYNGKNNKNKKYIEEKYS